MLEELLPCGHVYAAHDDDTLIGVAARKPLQGFAALEHCHPASPHWYLAFVGVDPTIQSRGVGRAPLSPVLETADRTNALCYLETPFPRTHAFYERLGFTRHAEHRAFRGAPQGVVAFLREPLTRGTAR